VYEKTHIEVKMPQYVELNAINKYLENHLYLNHSKQKTKIIKAHVFLPKASILHVKRERDVQVLDPKGLVDKYLGTQHLDTIQMYSTYHEGKQDAKFG
jgi:hypothetical protein